jgi:hypothetical protein
VLVKSARQVVKGKKTDDEDDVPSSKLYPRRSHQIGVEDAAIQTGSEQANHDDDFFF